MTTRKSETIGRAFLPRTDGKPMGRAFHEAGTASLPPVVLMDRDSLARLREVAERFGWPRGQSPGQALREAQKQGALDLSAMAARYGHAYLASDRASFLILPVLDDEQDRPDQFRVVERGGRMLWLPPDSDEEAEPTSPLALSILFLPFGGRQEDALADASFLHLYGGAKGGAKTETIVASAARQIEKPKYKALIFRKTNKALAEIELRARALYEPLGGVFNENDSEFTFPWKSIIELGHCETKEDAERYQGREFAFIGGDEFAQIADRRVLPTLIAECRCKDPSVRRMVRLTANPIGPGVPVLKRLFLDPCGYDGSRIREQEFEIPNLGTIRLATRFIPSRVTDNPVYRDDPIYMATLHSLPEGLRALLLDGDWSRAEGAALGELSWDKHWKEAFDVPEHWRIYAYFDWGFAHRWCFIIIAIDEKGDAWILDTLWGRRDYAHDIAGRVWGWIGFDGESRQHRKPKVITASGSCFERRSAEVQAIPTFAEQFAKHGLPLRRADESPGSRVTGLNNLRFWLAWRGMGEGDTDIEPGLKFMATPGNRILFKQLESMVPDPDNPEDVLKVDYDDDESDEEGINFSGDDGYDALKMFANDRPVAAKKPEEKPYDSPHYDATFDKRLRALAARTRPGGRGF